ncbi:MAG: hypothetical protein ACI8UZ_003340, partial [Akkermansiaceae bacterium]
PMPPMNPLLTDQEIQTVLALSNNINRP